MVCFSAGKKQQRQFLRSANTQRSTGKYESSYLVLYRPCSKFRYETSFFFLLVGAITRVNSVV